MKIIHYDLNVHLRYDQSPHARYFDNYGGHLQIEGSLTLLNTSRSKKGKVEFLLYRLFNLISVEMYCGKSLSFTCIPIVIEGERWQVLRVTVMLDEAIDPQAQQELKIQYGGPLCGYSEVMPYVKDHINKEFTLLRWETFWYPFADFMENRFLSYGDWQPFTYRLTIHAGSNHKAVTAGQLLEETCDNDATMSIWHQEKPAKLMAVAVAPYAIINKEKVSIYTFPAHGKSVLHLSECVNDTLKWCKEKLGPPGHSNDLRLVEIPTGYGSFSGEIIFQESAAFDLTDSHAYENIRKYGFIAHEVAHLWSVPSMEQPVNSRFLDESLTHYIEALLMQEKFGHDTFATFIDKCKQALVEAGESVAAHGILMTPSSPQYITTISRRKGPIAVYLLHRLMGERFFEVLATFTQRYLHQGSTPQVLLRMLGEEANFAFDKFEQDWFVGKMPLDLLEQSWEQILGRYR